MNKYEFTGVEQIFNGITLKQIRRIKDGLVGGWIEKEKNLSQEGDCFVYGDAKVYGNARIFGNARIYGNAYISGNALIFGNAEISGNAKIFENTQISGNAQICENAQISGNTFIYENARISGNAQICENAKIFGNARIFGDIKITKPGDYLNLVGLPYNVIIFHNRTMRIGCQLKTFDEWRSFQDYKESEVSEDEFNLMKETISPILEVMERKHGQNAKTTY